VSSTFFDQAKHDKTFIKNKVWFEEEKKMKTGKKRTFADFVSSKKDSKQKEKLVLSSSSSEDEEEQEKTRPVSALQTTLMNMLDNSSEDFEKKTPAITLPAVAAFEKKEEKEQEQQQQQQQQNDEEKFLRLCEQIALTNLPTIERVLEKMFCKEKNTDYPASALFRTLEIESAEYTNSVLQSIESATTMYKKTSDDSSAVSTKSLTNLQQSLGGGGSLMSLDAETSSATASTTKGTARRQMVPIQKVPMPLPETNAPRLGKTAVRCIRVTKLIDLLHSRLFPLEKKFAFDAQKANAYFFSLCPFLLAPLGTLFNAWVCDTFIHHIDCKKQEIENDPRAETPIDGHYMAWRRGTVMFLENSGKLEFFKNIFHTADLFRAVHARNIELLIQRFADKEGEILLRRVAASRMLRQISRQPSAHTKNLAKITSHFTGKQELLSHCQLAVVGTCETVAEQCVLDNQIDDRAIICVENRFFPAIVMFHSFCRMLDTMHISLRILFQNEIFDDFESDCNRIEEKLFGNDLLRDNMERMNLAYFYILYILDRCFVRNVATNS